MNASVPEEAGQTARTIVTSLQDSPLTLALVIFNIIFLGVVGYGTYKEREWRSDIINLMVKQQDKTAEMLYNCTPNKPQQQRNSLNLPLPYKLDLIESQSK